MMGGDEAEKQKNVFIWISAGNSWVAANLWTFHCMFLNSNDAEFLTNTVRVYSSHKEIKWQAVIVLVSLNCHLSCTVHKSASTPHHTLFGQFRQINIVLFCPLFCSKTCNLPCLGCYRYLLSKIFKLFNALLRAVWITLWQVLIFWIF